MLSAWGGAMGSSYTGADRVSATEMLAMAGIAL